MFITMIIATGFFAFMLAIGQVLMFIDPFAYWLLPFFVLMIWISKPFCHENLKTLEVKDFVLPCLFTCVAAYLFIYQDITINFGNLCYLYLSVFISFVAFSTSIRYKSLL